MHDRSPVRAVVFFLLVLAGAAAIGVSAYNAGVQHGAFEAARTAALPPEGSPAPVYVWAGPWHPGYFPVFPLFLGFFLLVFVLRGLLWRGSWGGRGCGPRRHDGVPPAFDEWHRRAHERMAGTPPPPERTA